MNKQPHISVLGQEVVDVLDPQAGDVIVDGTFGAGGYTRSILAAGDCTVVAIDRDPRAEGIAHGMAPEFGDKLIFVKGRFSEMDKHCASVGIDAVDGVTLDLGVSSMQFDEAERGFSFQNDGPLDMRMGEGGETAADVVNTMDESDLADIIYKYGDERKSRWIAKAIVRAREDAPIARTAELAKIVSDAVGFKRGKGGSKIHPATKTFQALRIYVNQELRELTEGLEAAERLLSEGGRLAVVSFHSLEDRIVKSFLLERSGNLPRGSRHLPDVPTSHPNPTFTLQGRGALKPTDAEVAANPRARSARLRHAVRTSAPAWSETEGRG